METEYAQWCSFCTSRQADGEVVLEDLGLPLPVCETCMKDYHNAVLPMLTALTVDEA